MVSVSFAVVYACRKLQEAFNTRQKWVNVPKASRRYSWLCPKITKEISSDFIRKTGANFMSFVDSSNRHVKKQQCEWKDISNPHTSLWKKSATFTFVVVGTSISALCSVLAFEGNKGDVIWHIDAYCHFHISSITWRGGGTLQRQHYLTRGNKRLLSCDLQQVRCDRHEAKQSFRFSFVMLCLLGWHRP